MKPGDSMGGQDRLTDFRTPNSFICVVPCGNSCMYFFTGVLVWFSCMDVAEQAWRDLRDGRPVANRVTVPSVTSER